MTIATGFVRGKEQKPILNEAEDYISRLLEIRRTTFLLCDVDTRKVWLVNGLSTLLYLVRAHLVHAENDELHRTVLMSKSSDLKAEGGRSGLKAAFETLRLASNRTLQLHPKDASSQKDTTQQENEDHFCLEELVKSFLHVLEQIVDHQSDFRYEEASVGYRVKRAPWDRLEGFDFMDVATRKRKISPRAMSLRADGKGWTQLTRALDAPTLFGKDFGEMLEPIKLDSNSSGCSVCHWDDTMPPGRDLLAAQIEDLLNAGTEAGSRLHFTNGFCLDIPSELFKPCGSSCQDKDRIRKLQCASENTQPLPSTRADIPTGLLTKAFRVLRMKLTGRGAEGGSSTTRIPPGGAMLLGMPREPSNSYRQTVHRYLNRPHGHPVKLLSHIDDPQVTTSSSQSNNATTNNLDSVSLRAQTKSTPLTQLSSPKPLSNSAEHLYGPESSASASLQLSQDDTHRRKRARRRAEEGKYLCRL